MRRYARRLSVELHRKRDCVLGEGNLVGKPPEGGILNAVPFNATRSAGDLG